MFAPINKIQFQSEHGYGRMAAIDRLEVARERMAVFKARGRKNLYRIVYADTIVSRNEIRRGVDCNGFPLVGVYDRNSLPKDIRADMDRIHEEITGSAFGINTRDVGAG
jgi:hypothetical protein